MPDPRPIPCGGTTVTYRDQVIPVVFARAMLGIGHSTSAAWPKLVIVRAGSRLIGLVVDTIEGAEIWSSSHSVHSWLVIR